MDCVVRWGDGMTFIAETGSQHLVTMDGAPEGGGRNLAPRPMEVLLAGAGGCTAYDVVVILKKNQQEVTGCEVALQAERNSVDLAGRRFAATIALIKALGGGWDAVELPKAAARS